MAEFDSALDGVSQSPATIKRIGVLTADKLNNDFLSGGSTGLAQGGQLRDLRPPMTPPSSLTFRIEAGFGYINDNSDAENPVSLRVSWEEFNDVVPLAQNPEPFNVTFVGIEVPDVVAFGVTEVTGQIFMSQRSDYPDTRQPPRSLWRTVIRLGDIVWAPAFNAIGQTSSTPHPLIDGVVQTQDAMEAYGHVVTTRGGVTGIPGTNRLKQAPVEIFGKSVNWLNDEAQPHNLSAGAFDPMRFAQFFQDPSGPGFEVFRFGLPPGPGTVDATVWDDGSGTLAAVPTGMVVVHNVYFGGAGHIMVIGQELFRTLWDAYVGFAHTDFKPLNFTHSGGFILVARVAIKNNGASDITDNANGFVANRSRDGWSVINRPRGPGGNVIQRAAAVPSTSGATITSDVFAVVPEMSVVFTPLFADSVVIVEAQIVVMSDKLNAIVEVQGHVDGVPFGFAVPLQTGTPNQTFSIPWQFFFMPGSTDPVTVTLQWRTFNASGNTAIAVGLRRAMVVTERAVIAG